MSSKSEIGMYVILGLVVVNIILTIYCYRRPQEDYRRGDTVAATPAPTPAKPVVIQSTAQVTTGNAKDVASAKYVASMQDANRANLVNLSR